MTAVMRSSVRICISCSNVISETSATSISQQLPRRPSAAPQPGSKTTFLYGQTDSERCSAPLRRNTVGWRQKTLRVNKVAIILLHVTWQRAVRFLGRPDARSVVCVFVGWSHGYAVQKRLNQSRCRLEGWLLWV